MEKINEAYLDSSVFITSCIDNEDNGRKARSVIKAVENQVINGYTSTLTFDEVVFVVRKIAGFKNSLVVGDDILSIKNLNFIDVTYQTVILAQELIKKYKLKPRDAIHAACAFSKGTKTMISDDADFDAIKEIKRIGIKEFRI